MNGMLLAVNGSINICDSVFRVSILYKDVKSFEVPFLGYSRPFLFHFFLLGLLFSVTEGPFRKTIEEGIVFRTGGHCYS